MDAAGHSLGWNDDLSLGGASDLWGDPVVAALEDGSYAVAWSDTLIDGDEMGVALRKISPQGEVGPALLAANEKKAFAQRHPDLLWTGQQLVVAWVDDAELFVGPDLRYRLFNAQLQPLSGDLTLAGTAAAEANVALGRWGTSWAAVWRSSLDGQETIEAQTADGQHGSWGPLPAAGPADDRPALLALDASRLLVVFSSRPHEDEPARLSAVVWDPSAADLPEVIPLATPSPELGAAYPALALAGEQVFLSWRTDAQPGRVEAEEVWLAPLQVNVLAGTISLGDIIPLPRQTTHRVGDQRFPALSVTGDVTAPSLVAVWEDWGADHTRVVAEFLPVPVLRLPEGDPENTAEACSDGLDQDGDAAVDCVDADCAGVCTP